jgi:hypothetical protein
MDKLTDYKMTAEELCKKVSNSYNRGEGIRSHPIVIEALELARSEGIKMGLETGAISLDMWANELAKLNNTHEKPIRRQADLVRSLSIEQVMILLKNKKSKEQNH